MAQKIYSLENYRHPISHLEGMLTKNNLKKIMIVCDNAFEFLPIREYVLGLDAEKIFFRDFKPNPLYENVKNGIKIFNEKKCDGIVAIGGGSAIDVAKCIKLFADVPEDEKFLEYKDVCGREVPLIAIPTTAGTGSESTRFAVIYYEGKKQSVNSTKIIPDYVILDGNVLMTLPDYQKKSTYLDAFCQAIESWWSVNRTSESIEYSKAALFSLCGERDTYFGKDCTLDTCNKILIAANYAGKAINLTQTTAPHAMSYKLSSICNIPHGHAVASVFAPCFEYMNEHILNVRNNGDNVSDVFGDIAHYVFGCDTDEFAFHFEKMMNDLGMTNPRINEDELNVLADSVNPVRLKNNPIIIDREGFVRIYSKFLKKEK